jgi:hypothetical protein
MPLRVNEAGCRIARHAARTRHPVRVPAHGVSVVVSRVVLSNLHSFLATAPPGNTALGVPGAT